MELSVTLGNEIWSWKHSEPCSLLVQEYAAALMRVTLRGFHGVTGGTYFGRSRTGFGIFGGDAKNGGVSTEGELLDLYCDSCQKKMLTNTQLIKGL